MSLSSPLVHDRKDSSILSVQTIVFSKSTRKRMNFNFVLLFQIRTSRSEIAVRWDMSQSNIFTSTKQLPIFSAVQLQFRAEIK